MALYADGEWAESDLLLSAKVGGMARRGLSQKSADVQICSGSRCMALLKQCINVE